MTTQSQNNTKGSISPALTEDMVYQLITLLQQMLDASGKGRMSEQFQQLMVDLNHASKNMEKLTKSLDANRIQNQKLAQIEETLNFIAAQLIEPQPTKK